MTKNKGWLAIVAMVWLVAGCESDNEHFCARYQYVYKQLLEEPDLPSYSEMKLQLQHDLEKADHEDDQAKFMLFVLEDWHAEIRPEHEDIREFCMRVKRWQYYP